MVFHRIGGAEGFGGAFANGGEIFQVVDGIEDGGVFGKALGDFQHKVFRFHGRGLCKKLARASRGVMRRGFNGKGINAKAQRRRDARKEMGGCLQAEEREKIESRLQRSTLGAL